LKHGGKWAYNLLSRAFLGVTWVVLGQLWAYNVMGWILLTKEKRTHRPKCPKHLNVMHAGVLVCILLQALLY